jgi:hypothetical protein
MCKGHIRPYDARTLQGASMARALGTDDSVTTCDCCGRSNLKFTVAIELDNGDVVHYGQVCASRNTGKTKPQISGEIKAHKDAQLKQAIAESRVHLACIAERARFAERTRAGVMPGRAAMEFVREAVEAADLARQAIALKYGVSPYSLL